ncbi:globin domain-containing protein [Spongiactinospora sp. TRM90649]|uniref:globin domain-containing protein n=1 Tax=Spongiactinospora sp. TRM90649 TaxID=3031114 RepID=UPI0023F993B6|nr:globin domain-containing protein [Spongiactinospora sp. TRM90649]MDF5757143.1 FAD-binding oxidoreductase [Spongiactinospora sp. TRM90649]
MSLNPILIKESFALIEPAGAKAAAYFYGRLFAESPRLRTMFPPAMDVQRERLFAALTRIVWSLDSPDGLASYLGQLGRDHRKYGVLADHYAAVGAALLATARWFAAPVWSGEMEKAWTAAYATAADIMIRAAEADAEVSPAWWPAEVIDHELRTGDIAVLTLRPARRLPYAPGQYVSVQTTRWPRVWRTFSIANAPREDNTVRLHVRAVSGGWVSTALTHQTRIGDSVMLGPALGAMTPADGSDRDVLAVAGGTGLAPIKAIVESLITSGRRLNIHLLYGARSRAELYDLPDLLRMRSGFPWLRVLPVVSADPGYDGLRGTLPEAIERFHSWRDHDAYVCGPPGMVTETVRRLRLDGVPAARIHRDAAPGEQ